MKRCHHTDWLRLGTHHGKPALQRSDRLDTLVRGLPYPDTQRPSLFVLIGNTEKSIAAQALFGIKKSRAPAIRRKPAEVHLHLDPSTPFTDRPVLLADYDARQHSQRWIEAKSDKCHETARLALRRRHAGEGAGHDVYAALLSPFADVFCLFADDLGGFAQIAHHLALWLDKSHPPTLPKTALPGVVVVTGKLPPRADAEEEAKRAFLAMLREATANDPYQRLSAIDVVALSPARAMSAEARHRRLKERIMRRSDQARRSREGGRMLFSATHFAAFLRCASAHVADAPPDTPFDFVRASRADNPVAADAAAHLSTFLAHVASSEQLVKFAAPMLASSLLLDSYPPDAHMFDCRLVFAALYEPVFRQASEARVLALRETNDVILRSGLVDMVEAHLRRYFEQLAGGGTAADVHRSHLARLQGWWHGVQSSSTCLCCLRRRPQYGLPCGHSFCENCVVVFGDNSGDDSGDDPWAFTVRRCFLCGQAPPTDMVVRVHPPTAGAGVLCIDGGGTRGIVPLVLMRRIQDRIGLPIPPQRFIKVAFGVSIARETRAHGRQGR
ncbi:phospholipase [Corynespora cassiicola Philippines]|uniref:Phospholipase n=1 Tax=Corynespora cassiicola Philippines TaxID=1448308 RepID=A0A2T2N1B4_CORCC|nr:phospholipase [Corynespora cassiicola Philippines]